MFLLCFITCLPVCFCELEYLLKLLLPILQGVKFERSTDVSGTRQDADCVEKEVHAIIEQVGEKHVVLVVLDGASPCKAAMARVEAKYNRIWCMRCMGHLLQLFFKDLQATTYFDSFISVHKSLVTFIEAHDYIWARFLKHSAHFNDGKELRPVKYGQTRYASWYRVVERNLALRQAYEATVADPEVVSWVEQQEVATRDSFAAAKQSILAHSLTTWDESQQIVDAFNQTYLLLRLFDGDTPCISKVFVITFGT